MNQLWLINEMEFLIKIVMAFAMGLISRWHGGGFFAAPKIVKNTVWGIVIGGAACYQLSGQVGYGWACALGLIAFILCGAGKATGHGGGMDIGHSGKEPGAGRSLEKLEPLIYWAYPYLPRWLYDMILMSITGLAAVAGAVLVLATVNPAHAALIALSGLAKGPAYAIGWMIWPSGRGRGPRDFDEPNEIGEFVSGFAVGLSL